MTTNLLHLACPTGQVSDGYHTFDELYEHRCLLFLALIQLQPRNAWRSKLHADGTSMDGWWIAGLQVQTGDIIYHLPDRLWEVLDTYPVDTRDRAPQWDGHDSAETIDRLRAWLARRHEDNSRSP